ncbi:MAG: hypothetical protein IKO40_13705, partial [Kiritimatiellae bacterium]|nr:hypothetical protein [Kiritimatiellia bacterium]
ADVAEEYSDVLDCHEYPGPAMFDSCGSRVSFLGEFGALGADAGPEHTWHDQPRRIREIESRTGKPYNYGEDPQGWREDLARRYEALCEKLLPLVGRGLGGSIYTQAQDIGIERDGFITYDRKVPKFDTAFLRRVHGRIIAAFRACLQTANH